MGRIEDLAAQYLRHITTPTSETIAGAERVIMLVYDKDQERMLRARIEAFENATIQAGRTWFRVDITTAFADWLAASEYREAYFESPDDLKLKLAGELVAYVADRIATTLSRPEADERSVIGVTGVGSLFGLARVSEVLKRLEPSIRGRLLVFFPGTYERGNYRLLDARDGWNYMAVPIAANASGDAL